MESPWLTAKEAANNCRLNYFFGARAINREKGLAMIDCVAGIVLRLNRNYQPSVIVLGLALLILCGCGRQPSAPVREIPVMCRWKGSSDKIRDLDALDEEAVAKAMDCWKPTKIGQAYYTHKVTGDGEFVNEIRDPFIYLTVEYLSEADKLNGVEWKGSISLLGAVREYVLQMPTHGNNPTEPRSLTWSKWRDEGSTSADFSRINGKWNVEYSRISTPTFKHVEASDLPKEQ